MAISVAAADLRRAYWDEGETLVDLGLRYGRAPGTVHGWFEKFGIPTRSLKEAAAQEPSAVTPEESRRMVRLYRQGLSSNDVAKQLKRGGRLVRTHLEAAGVMRGRQEGVRLAVEHGKIRSSRLNTRFFQVLTPESAWVLGLVFGDGHVRIVPGDQYAVTLAGTYRVLAQVAKLLGYNRKPRRAKAKGKPLNVWVLTFRSRVLVEDLLRYGLTGGKKATTMRWPLGVSSELLAHFVRGLWDSDGHWTRRYSYAVYACSSPGFVRSMEQVLRSLGWEPHVRKGTNILNGKSFTGYRIELRAAHSRELAQWLYRDSIPLIRCSRKHLRALQGSVMEVHAPAESPSWR